MARALSDLLLPTLETGINALTKVLDRVEAFATEKKIDPVVLLNTRLYPNMFPLIRQVQIVSDQTKNSASRLAGLEPPRFEDTETTIPELKARLAKALAHVRSIDPKLIDAGEGREIIFPMGPMRKGQMKGNDYLQFFVLPNFFFHFSMAYAILRQAGMEIGKSDYLGDIPITVTQN